MWDYSNSTNFVFNGYRWVSEREIEVLSLAGDGMTNRQIGEKLFLSPHTVARHLANARAKLPERIHQAQKLQPMDQRW